MTYILPIVPFNYSYTIIYLLLSTNNSLTCIIEHYYDLKLILYLNDFTKKLL